MTNDSLLMEEKKDEKKMVNGAAGGSNENGRTPSNNQKPNGGQPKWMQWVFFVTLALFIATLFYPGGDEKRVQKDLSYTKFQAYIEKGMVSRIVIYDDNTATAWIRPENYTVVFGSAETGENVKGELTALIPSVVVFTEWLQEVNNDRRNRSETVIDVSYKKSKDVWYLVLVNVLPWLLIFGFFICALARPTPKRRCSIKTRRIK